VKFVLQLALFRFAFAVTVLAYASHCDLRTREVSDLVWLVGYPVSFILTLADVFAGELSVYALAFSLAVSLCIGALAFYLGLMGGADALAFLFIGLALSAYPGGFPLLGDPLELPVFAVFCNSVLLSLVCPLAVFILNVTDMLRGKGLFRGVEVDGVLGKAVLLFTVRRVSLERLTSGLHYFPAERLVEKDSRFVRVPLYFVKAEADVSAITATMEENRQLYSDGALASPTLPMVVFLTFGLALLPIGNIMLLLVRHIIG
jgi:hypothetical protein